MASVVALGLRLPALGRATVLDVALVVPMENRCTRGDEINGALLGLIPTGDGVTLGAQILGELLFHLGGHVEGHRVKDFV